MMSSTGQPALSAPHSSHWIEMVWKVCICVSLSLCLLMYTSIHTIRGNATPNTNYFLGLRTFNTANTNNNAEAKYPNPANNPSTSRANNKYKNPIPPRITNPDQRIRTEPPHPQAYQHQHQATPDSPQHPESYHPKAQQTQHAP